MKTTTTKKASAAAPAVIESKTKVQLPPSFAARANQMAHRKGKQHADMWRVSTMGALQGLADEGASLEELSQALAKIEADPDGVLADGNKMRLESGDLK
jgi:hypothetical protein